MHMTRRGPPIIGLCILLLFALSACSDDPQFKPNPNPDSDRDASSHESDSDTGTVDGRDTINDHDTRNDHDGSSGSGFQLSGQFVPSGGQSMNNAFTLSGHLSSGTPEHESSNANFSLKIKPVNNQTAP